MNTYGIQKDGTEGPIFREAIGDTDIEKRRVDTVGKEGGGKNRASSIETYILLCVKYTLRIYCITKGVLPVRRFDF